MKILYYDCFAGISGDMNLGALIDLGVDADYLTDELQKLRLKGFGISITFGQQRKGISGTQVEVILTDEHRHETGDEHNHDHDGHDHDHSHDHHHDHDHDHSHTHEHPHHGHGQHHYHHPPDYTYATPEETPHSHGHHEHRNLHDIEDIINGSTLSGKVKEMSLKIFRLIAQAESKIHGKPVEEVHFHEVGAIDSIVDIVGAAICIDYLNPGRIIASPVEMGGGFVNCAHGTFPVPAPATLEIMKGKPMKLGAVPFETATPTGVAILAALADEFTETPDFTILATGYGIGHRDTEIPNVLRVCLGETGPSKEKTTEAIMLECNIDDMNPEYYTYVTGKLFAAGADDVFLQSITMKKGRPATLLSVLCSPEILPVMEHILFTETTTLGVRHYPVSKLMLERKPEIMDTPWGRVRIKKAYYRGNMIRWKPEYDDCAAIARKYDINMAKIHEYISQHIALN